MPAQGAISDQRPHLIETLRAENKEPLRLESHLARMGMSARALGLVFPENLVRLALLAEARQAASPSRVRVELSPDGTFQSSSSVIRPLDTAGLPSIIMAGEHVSSSNPLAVHKTNQRAIYDAGRARLSELPGVLDAVFLNERGEVCEGGISNIFIKKAGRLLTPPVSCGLLPGIMRAQIIRSHDAHEEVFFPWDLAAADAIYLTNSVRGMVEVVLYSG